MMEELKKLSPIVPHRFFRRNLVFAHRDFPKILESIKEKSGFYLYTGRGPSSNSMHIGHSVPFLLCKYLQDAFNVPLVIQITDDEKFLCKNMTFSQAKSNGIENIKDIIAHGFNPDLTYIFSNCNSSHLFIENILKVSRLISVNEAFKVFGFEMNTNIGMVEFPAREIAAAYSSSFNFLKNHTHCLIPCAVDQDPYFRLARDKAYAMGEKKPSTIYLSLLPDLQGPNRKMSASDPKSSIYLSDTPEEIEKKINKYAFTGGQETVEMHRKIGGNPDHDVPYQYLRYFLEDDETLEGIRKKYLNGEMLSGAMKKLCIREIQMYVAEYQQRRSKVDDVVLKTFMDITHLKK
jgi:tryptophanyl-tRNA synthetase